MESKTNAVKVWRLKELIDTYDAGLIPANEESWFAFYPTDLHEKDSDRWWIPYNELVAYSAFIKKFREYFEKK